MKILLTGKSGLVGHALFEQMSGSRDFIFLTPGRDELDLLKPESITTYLHRHRPDCIIHAAAYVNAGLAETERGDTQGLCYKTNVIATQKIVEAAKEIDAYTIYISTGSVFHGSEEHKGPFTEFDQPADLDHNGWYGYTKFLGEQTKPPAVVRIAHPLIPDSIRIKDDYLHKMLRLYDNHSLYPLFPDQFFPLTFIDDLSAVILQLMHYKLTGIFHACTSDVVSPYELFLYVLSLVGKAADERIIRMSIDEFYAKGNSPLRFAKYAAISSTHTADIVHIHFSSWKNGITKLFT